MNSTASDPFDQSSAPQEKVLVAAAAIAIAVPGLETEVLIVETPDEVATGCTGLRVWGCSLDFSSYLVHHAESLGLRDSTIVELGCGCALVGFTAALLGGKSSSQTAILAALNSSALQPKQTLRTLRVHQVRCAKCIWIGAGSKASRAFLTPRLTSSLAQS